jgi:hypothetical protein|tara:strand:+ start:284 stop:667 length:384 start_codon:yes stop_codon:yes gene_type:complete
MATNADWTVVFEDKMIIKQYGDDAASYKIEGEDSFWNDSKWSNIWAIQYKSDEHSYNDTVEYRDNTPHATWTDANLGSFEDQFISKWEAAHLAQLQLEWDRDNVDGETEAEKIARIGARPTSYSVSS